MTWKKTVFENFNLYAVTSLEKEDPQFLRKVEAAYRGGADIVQLRSKKLSEAYLFQVGTEMKQIAEHYHKLFFVNDRLELAIALEADGLHLGQEDLPVSQAKDQIKKCGKRMWVGKSTHSLDQAVQAEKELPDYLGVGPVFATPTKPSYAPVGTPLIRKVAENIQLPFVAIGGIEASNLEAVLEAGARRIAVVRAIFSAPDVYEATCRLKERIEKYCHEHA